ncbi:MAG: hypothetical protein V3T17_09160 [Pseudomonadales bacterium]
MSRLVNIFTNPDKLVAFKRESEGGIDPNERTYNGLPPLERNVGELNFSEPNMHMKITSENKEGNNV